MTGLVGGQELQREHIQAIKEVIAHACQDLPWQNGPFVLTERERETVSQFLNWLLVYDVKCDAQKGVAVTAA